MLSQNATFYQDVDPDGNEDSWNQNGFVAFQFRFDVRQPGDSIADIAPNTGHYRKDDDRDH